MRAAATRKVAWLGPLLVVPLLAGCNDERPVDRLNDELAQREAAVASCAASDCADEIALLVAALKRLQGVAIVSEATYQPRQGTDGASVSGALIVAPGVDCDDLEPKAAELGWQSSVSPLSSLDFDCVTVSDSTDSLGESAGFLFTLVRPTSMEQLEAWGDRGTLQ